MSTILQQTTDGLNALMHAAENGADPQAVRLAYAALKDQWTAAVRETVKLDPGSSERFVSLAAAASGEAFGPAIDAISCGRDPYDELRIPADAARWIRRAFDAHVRGDHVLMNECFVRAIAGVDSAGN